jgi:hypothetical protein
MTAIPLIVSLRISLMLLTAVEAANSLYVVIWASTSGADRFGYRQTTVMTGMSISGNTSVGVRYTVSPPSRKMTTDMTAKVYGRWRA